MNHQPQTINPSGFTLIELLVTSALIGTVGFLVSASLFNILRGAVKFEVIKEVKQNGDYAITIMDRMIRGAADVTSACSATGNVTSSLSLSTLKGNTNTFSCVLSNDSYRIASSSATVTGYLTNDSVTLGNPCTLQFTCITTNAGSRLVSIQFTLTQKSQNVPLSEQASENFKTTILLRNQ